jgi:L,D-transpeptidase catalytic domain
MDRPRAHSSSAAKRRTGAFLAAGLILGASLLGGTSAGYAAWWMEIMWGRMPSGYSIDERLAEFGVEATARLAPYFAAVRVPMPPAQVSLVAFKDARVLELYARAPAGPWRLARRYPILAASGVPGPKLRAGDKQVPEGIYPVILLNPNSRFHVSLRLGYPNEFDRRMAFTDGRADLGGDIMIHGSDRSIGCLAMGDEAAEELFALAALVGMDHLKVVISPTDLRLGTALQAGGTMPAWTARLYADLATELAQYPVTARTIDALSNAR